MSECREAFEAWYQRVGGPKGAVKIDAGVGFQAGWNARPGVTVPVEVAALREIVEIYAGMEGFVPATCGEGYLLQTIKQIMGVVSSALKGGGDAEE